MIYVAVYKEYVSEKGSSIDALIDCGVLGYFNSSEDAFAYVRKYHDGKPDMDYTVVTHCKESISTSEVKNGEIRSKATKSYYFNDRFHEYEVNVYAIDLITQDNVPQDDIENYIYG